MSQKTISELIKEIKRLNADLAKERVVSLQVSGREAAMDVLEASSVALCDLAINLRLAPTTLVQMVCALYEQRIQDFSVEEMERIVDETEAHIRDQNGGEKN